MTLTKQSLAAIQMRAEKATSGPWWYDSYRRIFAGRTEPTTIDICKCTNELVPERNDDLVFIAHARTDVPLLCDEVERLQAEVERLQMTMSAEEAERRGYDRAIVEIAAERRRQVDDEGWTLEHDDKHSNGEMARAAACYCKIAAASDATRRNASLDGWQAPRIWPFDRRWWKPKDRRRDLIRAGALIVAEIERLDRAEEMTMADDLQTRLRAGAGTSTDFQAHLNKYQALCDEAADKIAELEAMLDQLILEGRTTATPRTTRR